MYQLFLKKLFDIVFALLAFIVLFPFFILIAMVLFFINKGNPFFFQQRPGQFEKPIFIIKFKSMTDEKDAEGKLLPDNKRVTKFGAFIRKFSLDEIPQLLNVLKGDMSIVGPRPLLFKYLPLYNDEQKKRHLVKPGITGWAQVNGRNAISWHQKFTLDVYYQQNISLVLDVKILLLTILKVIKAKA